MLRKKLRNKTILMRMASFGGWKDWSLMLVGDKDWDVLDCETS